MSLATLLEDQAMVRADAMAIADHDREWTYGEAAEHRGRLARALLEHGVEPGDRVGIHCKKGFFGFVAMHAIVSLGAIAVPLDPASPPTRLAKICERMEIDVVVCSAAAQSIESIHGLRPLRAVIGVASELLSDQGCATVATADLVHLDPVAPRAVSETEPSYIITTSGSTGEPKGIVHSHRSARAYAEMVVETYGLFADDRVSDIAPYHFDISTLALWAVPMAGASNVIVSEPYQLLPASHSQLLEDQRVTFWYSVPFLMQQLVTRGDLENRDLSALRWVHFGGEVMAPETVIAMMQHCPNARFANIFGPAETNQSTLAVFDSPPPTDAPLSIGFPLADTEVRVLAPGAETPAIDDCVALGVQGEMWTHTPQLMDGYVGQPELNAHVLKEVDGKRFYRSGDLVSQDESGELTFHGRIDHQVKVRGFRIELEGVESELEKLGLVEYVVVGVRRAHSNQDELVAGLLGTPADFDEESFLRSAASVLPSYAVPNHLVPIATPTFTGSGKLDRRSLRQDAIAAFERMLE